MQFAEYCEYVHRDDTDTQAGLPVDYSVVVMLACSVCTIFNCDFQTSLVDGLWRELTFQFSTLKVIPPLSSGVGFGD